MGSSGGSAGETAAAAKSRWRRRLVSPESALVGLVALLALPYGALGAGWFREDWLPLRNVALRGVWMAGDGAGLGGRPLASLVYALTFGVVGAHPLLHLVILTALNAAVGVLLYRAAALFVDRRRAFWLAAVWAVIPTHSALSHWASAVHIVVALLLFLAGVLRLGAAARQGTPGWDAIAWFAASALAYEATLPTAAVAVLVVPGLLGAQIRRDLLVRGWLVFSALFVYVLVATDKRTPTAIRASDVVSSNLGWGLVGDSAPWALLQLVILATAASAAFRVLSPSWRPRTGPSEAMIVAGFVLIVVGAAPFAGFGQEIDFIGLGDRANVISAIGAAVILVGLAGAVGSARLGGVAVAAVVACTLPQRIAVDVDYGCTAEAVERAMALIDEQMGVRRTAVVGPAAIGRGGVEGLNNEWDTGLALQQRRHDPAIRLRYVYSRDELRAEPGSIDILPAAAPCEAVQP